MLASPFSGREATSYPPQWVASEQGALAVLWFGHAEVHLVRYDAGGKEQLRRIYPRSHRAGLRDGPDAPLRLAGGRMLLASDDSLVLGAWSINPDCTPRHGSSFVVLDPAGDLRAWIDGDEVLGMALSSEDVVAVRRGWGSSEVELLDLDGQLVGTVEPPRPWQEERDELRAAAAHVGPDSDPSEWVQYYSFIDVGPSKSGDGPAVDDWIVDAWPANAGELPAGLVRRLGPRLCAKERVQAPAEVLEAFRAETNYSRRLEYLPALAACFDEPPESALELARLAVSRKDHFAAEPARKALVDWGMESEYVARRPPRGPPGLTIDEAWNALMLPGAGAARDARWLLVSNLPLIEVRIREALAVGGSESEAIVRLLHEALAFSSMGRWGDGNRGVLERLVAEWSDASPTMPSVERLRDLFAVLLNGDAEAAGRLFHRIADEPDTGFWLGLALAGAQSPPYPAPDNWVPPSALPSLARRFLAEVDIAAPETCAKAGDSWTCGGIGVVDPLLSIAGIAGEGAMHAVWSRLTDSEVSDADHRIVVSVAGARSELLTSEQWRWLLERSERLLAREELAGTLQLLRVHPGPAEPSWPSVQELFRRLVETHGMDRVLNVGNFSAAVGGIMMQRNALIDLLRPEDLLGVVRSPEDVPRWLGLIAAVGAWPQIAGELETMLDGHAGLQAALALAPLGDRRALEVLLDRGLTDWGDPVPGLRHFGQEAIDRLVGLAHHENGAARSRARRALRELGMPKSLQTALEQEARDRLEAGETPELESWLLLADGERDAAESFVRWLAEGNVMVAGGRPQHVAGYPRVVEILARMADDGSSVRAEALRMLEEWAKFSPAAKESLAALR